jgi:cytochrome c-type biogenesis protein CcmH
LSFVPYIGLTIAALAAIAFATWPVWRDFLDSRSRTQKSVTSPDRRSRTAGLLLTGAVALFVLGIGGGIYAMVGEPHLAIRASQGTNMREINGLAPPLIERVRQNPDDEQAWIYLAQIYVAAQDADSAAGALGHAVLAARNQKRETPELDTTYGEMLVNAAGGQVPPPAENAFAAALAADPKNAPARYYLGMALAQKGNRDGAQRYWKSLLDDIPTTAPLHQRLVDMLASLGTPTPNVQGAGGAPDINAMVSGLAARLAADPNDPAGWQRLIRAYSVLGETDKAKAALATARNSAGADKAALDAEANELKLE